MFLPANLVYHLAHMLHDVEAVVDDLVCRIWYVLNCSLEVRFPHVHDHGLDALDLLRRELLVKSSRLSVLRSCVTNSTVPSSRSQTTVM